MQTTSSRMDKLLADAKRSAYSIPRFQRDFVWTLGQVKLLIDSIARNYPIGSLLFLAETNPAEPFLNGRSIRAELDQTGLDHNDSVEQTNQFYVLDGQQRLTSIVRVFLQGEVGKTYYFDLRRLRDFADQPNRIDWIVQRASTVKMPIRYLRADTVIDRQRCQVLVEEYFETNDEELKGDRPKQRAASALVNSVFETIRNYQFPFVVLDRNESLEAICRIFETINSTGTRLTTFDLAVARFYPHPDLQELWDESRRSHPVLARYEVDGEKVLQVVALLEAVDKGAVPSVTRSTLLNIKPQSVADRWSMAVAQLAAAYEWAESRGSGKGLVPNAALMVPMAVFFLHADEEWKRKQSSYQAILDKWYLASSLQQGARKASNYHVAESTGELMRWRREGVPLSPPRVFLTPGQISRLRSTDSRYRAIMAFLRWRCDKDLWTGCVLSPDGIEDHHLFPAALAKRYDIERQLLDSVSNRILVSKDTNRSLGDRLPHDYLAQLVLDAQAKGVSLQVLGQLEQLCIKLPTERGRLLTYLNVSNVNEFVRHRSQQIFSALESVLESILIHGDEADEE